MTTAEKLGAELSEVLSGDAWYGSPVYEIIDATTFDVAYERPPGGAHSVVEIVLHMIGWTEEVNLRMQGKEAGMPPGGDWPDAGEPDEERWQKLKDSFKLVNVALIDAISQVEDDKWQQPTNDKRNAALGTGVTYEALIRGLIQHHVYHAGQVAILNKMLGGL